MVELKDRYKDLKSTVARQQKDMGGTTAAQQENIQVRRVQGTVKLDMGAEVTQPLLTSLQVITAHVTACQHQCSDAALKFCGGASLEGSITPCNGSWLSMLCCRPASPSTSWRGVCSRPPSAAMR